MMKRILALILCGVLLLACSHETDGAGEKDSSELPEKKIIWMALNDSGHILNAIAENQGYFEDEGITVRYIHVSTDADAFEGLWGGTIDILSNSGTNLPLQHLSEGLDITIFAGYLLSGCLPIIGRVDAKWNGIDDLIGKTMACEPNMYAVTGPLLDKGYDPVNDIKWYNPEDQMDRIQAVVNGEADYALVGTPFNYEVLRNPNVKIMTYANDILPDYSCCRALALSSWVKENPNTLKALLRAWIRAMEYYQTHHDETVAYTVKMTGQSEEYVRAYLDNPRFNLNTGPMKSSVVRAWDYMDRLGLLSPEAKKIDINEHVNTTLYKEALDECQKLYGEGNPSFYEKLQVQFAENNQ